MTSETGGWIDDSDESEGKTFIPRQYFSSSDEETEESKFVVEIPKIDRNAVKINKKKPKDTNTPKKVKKKPTTKKNDIDKLLEAEIRRNEKLLKDSKCVQTKENTVIEKVNKKGKKKLWEQLQIKRQIEIDNVKKQKALKLATERQQREKEKSGIPGRSEPNMAEKRYNPYDHTNLWDGTFMNETPSLPDLRPAGFYDPTTKLTYFFDESDPKLPQGTIGIKVEKKDDGYYDDNDSDEVLIAKFKERTAKRNIERSKAEAIQNSMSKLARENELIKRISSNYMNEVTEDIVEFSLGTNYFADHMKTILQYERGYYDDKCAKNFWLKICKGVFIRDKGKYGIEENYIDGTVESIIQSTDFYQSLLRQHIAMKFASVFEEILDKGLVDKFGAENITLVSYQKNLQETFPDCDLIIPTKRLMDLNIIPKNALNFNPFEDEDVKFVGFAFLWSLNPAFSLFGGFYKTKEVGFHHYWIVYNRFTAKLEDMIPVNAKAARVAEKTKTEELIEKNLKSEQEVMVEVYEDVSSKKQELNKIERFINGLDVNKISEKDRKLLKEDLAEIVSQIKQNESKHVEKLTNEELTKLENEMTEVENNLDRVVQSYTT